MTALYYMTDAWYGIGNMAIVIHVVLQPQYFARSSSTAADGSKQTGQKAKKHRKHKDRTSQSEETTEVKEKRKKKHKHRRSRAKESKNSVDKTKDYELI